MAKRVRDYQREEQRRNEIARERGYTSRAQLRAARSRGQFPSEREIRDNTEAAVRALSEARQRAQSEEFRQRLARSRARVPERKPKVEFTETQKPAERKRGRTYKDEQSYQWSLAHSRGDRSKYSDNMSRAQRDAYYAAYVDGWDLPHDERDLEALYDYLIDYWDFDPDPYSPDWTGYARKSG